MTIKHERTTRMLEEAVESFNNGNNVIIYTHTQEFASNVINRLEYITNDTVKKVTNGYNNILRGNAILVKHIRHRDNDILTGYNFVTFVDHYLYEYMMISPAIFIKYMK